MVRARAVRIATGRRIEPTAPSEEPPEAVLVGELRPNIGGTQRAFRTFALIFAALVAIYAGFLGALASSPKVGERGDVAAYGVFTILFVAIGVADFLLTVYRAPVRVRDAGVDFVVTERLGRLQRFPKRPTLSARVLKQYPAGFLAEVATELVRLSVPDGTVRQYLVDRGLLPLGSEEP